MKKFKKKKNTQKNVIIFSSNLNLIFGWEDIEILFSLFLEKLYRIEYPLKKHQSRINWNFEQKVIAKIRNRCRR